MKPVLFSGTPGVGKSTLAQMIQERTNMQWVNVGELAKQYNYFDGYDDERDCPYLDEEKVLITYLYLKFLKIEGRPYFDIKFK